MAKSWSARIGLVLLVLGVAALSGSLGWWLAPTTGDQRPSAPLLTAKRYPEPRVIADFKLLDGRGESFGIERWKGRWNLVFFGFTHCPDVCPTTLAQLNEVATLLQRRLAEQQRPEITFVSVDPQRDTTEKLSDYAAYFNPAFHAATGTHPQLRALTMQLGLIYAIEPQPPATPDYSVDHSAAVVLLDPSARLYATFPAPHEAVAMAADLAAIIGG